MATLFRCKQRCLASSAWTINRIANVRGCAILEFPDVDAHVKLLFAVMVVPKRLVPAITKLIEREQTLAPKKRPNTYEDSPRQETKLSSQR